jgi:hypothetical protein
MSHWIGDLAKLVREDMGATLAALCAAIAFLVTIVFLSLAEAIAAAVGVAALTNLVWLAVQGVCSRVQRQRMKERETREANERAVRQAKAAQISEEEAARAFAQIRARFSDVPILEFTTLAARFLDDPELSVRTVDAICAERKGLARRTRTYNVMDHVPVVWFYAFTSVGVDFVRSAFGSALIAAAKEFCRDYRRARNCPRDGVIVGGNDALQEGEPATVGDLYARAEAILRERGGPH